MRYALLYFGSEDEVAPATAYAPAAGVELVVELLPSTTAITVRTGPRGPVALDGPCHAGPADLLAVHVVVCADLEAALALAQARGADAQVCEIRPLCPAPTAASL